LIAKIKQDLLADVHNARREAEKLSYHNPSLEIKLNMGDITLPFQKQFEEFDPEKDPDIIA